MNQYTQAWEPLSAQANPYIHALLLAFWMAAAGAMQAQVAIQSGASTAIDFNDFRGQGITANPGAGQLDSKQWAVQGLSDGDLAFGESMDSGDYARGTTQGGFGTGGLYGVELESGNYALGVQPIGSDWTPGAFTLRLQNQTGGDLSMLSLSYDVWINNDQDRADSFNFSYSIDNADYLLVPGLNLTSSETRDSLGFQPYARSTQLAGFNVADSDFLYLRWQGDDVSGTGLRDEFALDNIHVSAVPEPEEYALITSGLLLMLLLYRARQNARVQVG